MKLFSCLILVCLCGGCLVVKHETVLPNGVVDKGSVAAFLTTDAAGKINTHSSIKGSNYVHGSSATDLSVTGDAAMIQAISAGIAAGLAEAAKKGAGVP